MRKKFSIFTHFAKRNICQYLSFSGRFPLKFQKGLNLHLNLHCYFLTTASSAFLFVEKLDPAVYSISFFRRIRNWTPAPSPPPPPRVLYVKCMYFFRRCYEIEANANLLTLLQKQTSYYRLGITNCVRKKWKCACISPILFTL
jgi:hypothetical protein